MQEQARKASLQRFVEAFNQGELDVVEAMIAPEFYEYVPLADEPTATEVFRGISRDLRAAFPGLHLSLTEVAMEGDQGRARMELSGQHLGTLWGLPPSGKSFTFPAEAVFRFVGDRFAVAWPNTHFIPTFREIGLAPLPENAHKKPVHPVRLPEVFLRLAFNGLRLQEKPCAHLNQIRVTETSVDVCADCVATGDEWPALRMCIVCGYVGCCDLAVNKHMRKHFEATGHPIIRSIQPGERWRWCYVDSAFLLPHG